MRGVEGGDVVIVIVNVIVWLWLWWGVGKLNKGLSHVLMWLDVEMTLSLSFIQQAIGYQCMAFKCTFGSWSVRNIAITTATIRRGETGKCVAEFVHS